MEQNPPTPVQRFAEAGMLDPATLSEPDTQLINSLSEQEVTAFIGAAQRLFDDQKEIIKLGSLTSGNVRFMVPL